VEPLPDQSAAAPTLARALGTWDVALITFGSIVGSAVFVAAAIVPRAVPHAGLALALWAIGCLLAVAGALTYAELGTMFPEAGGQYHYLKHAFGPLWGFLFGWTAFLVVQAGSIAYMAVAFGNYLSVFVPSAPTQLIGAAVIVLLGTINYFGVRQGATVQNVLTAVKIASVVGLVVLGLTAPATSAVEWTAPLPHINLVTAAGLGLLAVLGCFDGWYQATFSAGELRDPSKSLPRGMIAGTFLVGVLYLLINVVYFRALPVEAVGQSERIGEAAVTALLGANAGRLMSLAILVSVFGCLSATILTASRICLPMAQDGLLWRGLATIHPRHRTPGASIIVLCVWSVLLLFSGSYEQLFDYAIFAAFVFHAATGVALFALRHRRPDALRPYRVWGYPLVPAIFVLTSLGLVLNTLWEKPRESLLGLGIVALGALVYLWTRAKSRRG
jgi:APA family basic amino acid/polyamine antiporter